MTISKTLRSVAAFALIFCLWMTPIAVLAADKGEKNFKQGMKYEEAEQWDKAAEEFALAVAAKPKNAEYRLHYQRSLFNASQMMMQRGRTLAEQKDYVGAYNAFRQAYGYDPVNELAKSEMNRMLRLQKEAFEGKPPTMDKNTPDASPSNIPNIVNGVKVVPTSYNAGGASVSNSTNVPVILPQEVEQLRDIKYTKVDLKTVIKELASPLDLNVLFDTETFRSPRDVTIELKNVTTAQALDAIFLQEGLFFQKVGKRMVLIATQNRRQQFQQLVLRTFYLANANPETVKQVLLQAIPPQPGRPPTTAITDKDTNSITVRDTSENIRLIANLVRSLDKDRAEVVMDVNIYEVSKTDLLRFGNQIGTEASLGNLGGTTSGKIGIGEGGSLFGRAVTTGAAAVAGIPTAIGAGILLPAAQLTAFQSKNNTKLLASTQVHAFNNEESQARIGQRVPVRTAQLLGYNQQVPGQPGGGNNNFNNAASVYNYEQVGLTLKFTPIVFPNQDVQVKMSIESKDVINPGTDTPSFTERSISGTARIQNNRTMLLASVAQDNQSNGRQGLPLLGLIPILGRFFTAPVKNNNTTDIVIAVTPRVLRAPAILPEDENEQPTGSISQPTNSSLAEMIVRENQEDQIAAARRLTNNVTVRLPDVPAETTAAAPAYVPANNAPTTNSPAATTPILSTVSAPANDQTNDALKTVVPKPIDTTVKTLTVSPTVDEEKPKEKP
jgi:general secretion pathway protein D